jgi:hypothetical protein
VQPGERLIGGCHIRLAASNSPSSSACLLLSHCRRPRGQRLHSYSRYRRCVFLSSIIKRVLVLASYGLCEPIIVPMRLNAGDREWSDDANKGRYDRSTGVALRLRCGCPLCSCRRSHRAWGRRGDDRAGHIYDGPCHLLCDLGIGRPPRMCSDDRSRMILDDQNARQMIVELRTPLHAGT